MRSTTRGRQEALPSEESRIQAVIEGRRDAAESLLTDLLPRVRNLVRYLMRGDHDVDDIAQEALIAILRGLPTWRREGSFKSWSDRVVARTTFAAMRKVRDSGTEPEAEPMELTVLSEESLPDDYVFRRDMVRLMDELSDEQRHALVLHYVLEMSVPEMTEELGIPFETVRSRLRLGRANLRALYARESGTNGGAE
ncbi:RNA polymerase sigma-70 factor, ECF subfamily [Cystobacter fuscus DSM 2262]|uniref:RNA polymerase sigma-70 factor, ECF subfamily n=1 Tax=Cystobacter fuscus (strain ATCC 25194 / DSM 2262 / NBRC 100088 / M29) TaxID=1242864 RepID=S9P244_CYSF2|nr:RNA polymerase sigma factor [Cystobacter fuscus]EPX58530.1 RNA polymerase sigma-70 factor, ECF subfamily [Cystobacter fuscus DSM 2262]